MDKRTPLLWMIPLSMFLFILNGGIPCIIVLWIGYFIYATAGVQVVPKRDEKGRDTGKVTIKPADYPRGPKWYSPVSGDLEHDRRQTAYRREYNDWRRRIIKNADGTPCSPAELEAHKSDPFWQDFGEY